MTPRPKPVRLVLKSKPALRRLELELSAQKALLARVRRVLPDELADHCVFAQLRGGRLLLHVDSPAWATRLRFLAPRLASVIGNETSSLTEIKVRPRVDHPRRAARRRPAYRSDYAADVVDDSAAGIGDAGLQEALLRLGRRLRAR